MTDHPGIHPAEPQIAAGPVPPVDDRESRAVLIAWLAGFFTAPPTPPVIETLRRGGGADLLADLATDPELGDGVSAMRRAIAGSEDDAVLGARLGRSFGLLFLGIAGPATVSPYESAWRGEGRLFQAPVAEIDELLAQVDRSVALPGEPSDHVAIEAALLAHLVGIDHPARIGLAERLTDWFAGFDDAVSSRDDTGFFAGAARALGAAIRRECAHPLREDPEEGSPATTGRKTT